MNDKKQNESEPKTGLIDRRFFLKKTSAAVAVVAAGSIISTSIAENQIPAETGVANVPAAATDNNETNKQWKAGWMAF